MKILQYLFFLVIVCGQLLSQNNQETILTIDDDAISVAEFKSVYLKNSDLLDQKEKINPKKYMDLFIAYKLKVKEAYKNGFHKRDSYLKELKGYRKQLAKGFLTDVAVTDKLVKEAYDRTLQEVKASHILIKVQPNATSEDTLKAYNRIIEARNKIINGTNFSDIAKEYSEDPSAKTNAGNLGWFKAFKMVYDFENAAYATKVGEVSMPFKTRFGYHIVQTNDKRISKGSVKVAHIMVSFKQKDSTIIPQERINDLYEQLQQGADFSTLARSYSDDKQTSVRGGEIRPFESGQLSSPEFENAAFSLTKTGQLSKPVESKFGWHIIKLIEKIPVKSFEEQRTDIENKIKRDARAKVISNSLQEKLQQLYKLQDISSIVAKFAQPDMGKITNNKWEFDPSKAAQKETAFVIEDSSFVALELSRYLGRSYNKNKYATKEQFLKESIQNYVNTKLKIYHEKNLEEKEPEFEAIIREYREGLLIFDLMEAKIWSKAKNDSIGIATFYDQNKSNYIAPKSAIVDIYSSATKKELKQLCTQLKANPLLSISKTNSDTWIVSSKTISLSDTGNFVKNFKIKKGISKIYKTGGNYVLYNVKEVLPEKFKTLNEAKGQVISDYQQYLEKEWIDRLRAASSIKVNNQVLDRLQKQLE